MNKLKEILKSIIKALFVDLKKIIINKIIEVLEGVIDKLRSMI